MDSSSQDFWIEMAILGTALLSLTLMLVTHQTASPTVAILNRWVRWFFISITIAGALVLFDLSQIAFAPLLGITFLCWFLIETLYNWIAIKLLSQSNFPLFPKFEVNSRNDEWPNQSALITLKSRIRKSGFQRTQSLVAKIGEQVLMNLSCFDNKDATIRLMIYFLPQARGNIIVCGALQSITESGKRLITDNLFLPFGGFYPETWLVERRPWMRNFDRLYQRHLARIDSKAETLVPHRLDPLDQINRDQQTLEGLNRELGFLNSPSPDEEVEQLTAAGRARLWHELWTLSYFGKPLRYS